MKISTEQALHVAKLDDDQLARAAKEAFAGASPEAIVRAAAKQLASDYTDISQRLQAASEAALNLIGQASVAEAQLHEVQFMLLRRLGKELGRAEGDVPTMEEAVKLKGPRWMLEVLVS